MRKFFFVSLLLTGLTAIIFTACQKEVDFALTTNNQVTGDFRAKIGGTQWVANKVAVADISGGMITLVGISTDKKMIGIIVDDNGVGTYTLDENSFFDVGTYTDSAETNPNAYSTNQGPNPGDAGGTLTITSIDATSKRISGTFSFKVYRQFDNAQKNITEGSFTNISYAPVAPPTNSTDTFRVKIGGTQWIPPMAIAAKTPAQPPMPAQIVVTGTDLTSLKAVGLFMPADITPGSYTLDLFGATYIGQYNPDSDPTHSQASTTGTLTILEHNTTTKRIRGNFNFHAETILPPIISSELTEGYFSMKYQ
jgi:hypothetical protein